MKVALLYGSHRPHRQGIKGARFVERKLKERDHEVFFIDAMEQNLPVIDKMYKEYEPGKAPAKLEALAKLYKTIDGFMIVSGEYNHSIPPGLSNLMCPFMEEYFFRPSAVACYSMGPFGGVRAAMQLRAFLCEVGMPSIATLFPMSMVHQSFDEDGKALDVSYETRIKKFLDEFEWYAHALKDARAKGLPY